MVLIYSLFDYKTRVLNRRMVLKFPGQLLLLQVVERFTIASILSGGKGEGKHKGGKALRSKDAGIGKLSQVGKGPFRRFRTRI